MSTVDRWGVEDLVDARWAGLAVLDWDGQGLELYLVSRLREWLYRRMGELATGPSLDPPFFVAAF